MWWQHYRNGEHVTWGQLRQVINHLYERMDTLATADDVAALETALDQVASDLATSQSALQAEIDQLASANPGVDLSGLQSRVQALDQSVQAVGALKPSVAQPPPAPADQPPADAGGGVTGAQ